MLEIAQHTRNDDGQMLDITPSVSLSLSQIERLLFHNVCPFRQELFKKAIRKSIYDSHSMLLTL